MASNVAVGCVTYVSGGWVSVQNVLQSPYMQMAQKSVSEMYTKILCNCFIAYWIYKNSLKIIHLVHCTAHNAVIPLCHWLAQLYVGTSVNATNYFRLIGFSVVLYNTLCKWLSGVVTLELGLSVTSDVGLFGLCGYRVAVEQRVDIMTSLAGSNINS
jgi:hypothetical protein